MFDTEIRLDTAEDALELRNTLPDFQDLDVLIDSIKKLDADFDQFKQLMTAV